MSRCYCCNYCEATDGPKEKKEMYLHHTTWLCGECYEETFPFDPNDIVIDHQSLEAYLIEQDT